MIEPNTWLSSFAPGYSNLSRSERRAVTDFVLLWSVYEAQVCGCNATAQRMLEKLDQWHDQHPLECEKSDESWMHFVDRLTNGDGLQHHFEGLRISNQQHAELVREAVLCVSPEPDQLTRHRAMAIIVHRIRNNLLHGEKWSYGLAHQADNFRHASNMLMLWMDIDRNKAT